MVNEENLRRSLVLVLLFAGVFLIGLTSGFCVDYKYVVPGGNIQSAINSVEAGGVVVVYQATFVESLIINKSLTLDCRETGGVKPVIDVTGFEKGVLINSSNVSFMGCDMVGDSDTKYGIFVDVANNVSNLEIKNNIVRGMNKSYSYGVFADYGVDSVLSNVVITGNSFENIGNFTNGNDRSSAISIGDFVRSDEESLNVNISSNHYENVSVGIVIDAGFPLIDEEVSSFSGVSSFLISSSRSVVNFGDSSFGDLVMCDNTLVSSGSKGYFEDLNPALIYSGENSNVYLGEKTYSDLSPKIEIEPGRTGIAIRGKSYVSVIENVITIWLSDRSATSILFEKLSLGKGVALKKSTNNLISSLIFRNISFNTSFGLISNIDDVEVEDFVLADSFFDRSGSNGLFLDMTNFKGNVYVDDSVFVNSNDDIFWVDSSLGSVDVHGSKFIDVDGFAILDIENGIVNASFNYWGTGFGPYHPQLGGKANVSGDILFLPFYEDETMQNLIFERNILNVSEVNVSESGKMFFVPLNNEEVEVNIERGADNVTLNFAALADDSFGDRRAGLNKEIFVRKEGVGNVSLSFTENVSLIGSSNWDDRVVLLSFLDVDGFGKSKIANLSKYNVSILEAVGVGSVSEDLVLDLPVKMVFEGAGDKSLGYFDLVGNFSIIDSSCPSSDNLSQIEDFLNGSVSACRVLSGNDLVLWTKHFSSFVVYSLTDLMIGLPTNPDGPSNSGGGGSSSSSSCRENIDDDRREEVLEAVSSFYDDEGEVSCVREIEGKTIVVSGDRDNFDLLSSSVKDEIGSYLDGFVLTDGKIEIFASVYKVELRRGRERFVTRIQLVSLDGEIDEGKDTKVVNIIPYDLLSNGDEIYSDGKIFSKRAILFDVGSFDEDRVLSDYYYVMGDVFSEVSSVSGFFLAEMVKFDTVLEKELEVDKVVDDFVEKEEVVSEDGGRTKIGGYFFASTPSIVVGFLGLIVLAILGLYFTGTGPFAEAGDESRKRTNRRGRGSRIDINEILSKKRRK